MLESIEKSRKKLWEDAVENLDFAPPAPHWFKDSATVEEYDAALNEIEQEVSERCILLPLDANSVPIHIEDMMTDGVHKFKVFGLAVSGNGLWIVRNKDGNTWAACDLTHYHEPTVEDVLREFAHVGIRIAAKHEIKAGEINFYADEEAIAEYAKRLRLAETKEAWMPKNIDKSQETPKSRETEAGVAHEPRTYRDTDEPRTERAERLRVGILKYAHLILVGSILLGAVFGAWFGISMWIALTGHWLIVSLWAYVTSIKAGDGE